MSEAAPAARKRTVPLWARILIVAVLVPAAIFLLFHLYAIVLRFAPVPGTILMSQRAGQGQEVRADWVPLERISPRLVYAVIAAEDAKFCTHGGIDWDAVEAARAWNEKNPNRNRRGGSTISQQTAKNVFFWNGGGMARKTGEAWMTYVIEAVWGKRRIMEVYLNVAEWGDGLFGAEAAAQARFGKSAADLTEREAALLASVLPSPNRWRAVNPGPYVQQRASSIQGRMRVVANEGYAACIFGEGAPKLPPRETPKGETPPPPAVLPEIPDAPESGEESLGDWPEYDDTPEARQNANDELNDLLNAADDTFRAQPLPEPGETPEAAGEVTEEPVADLAPSEPEPATEPPAGDPEPAGPADLRPPE